MTCDHYKRGCHVRAECCQQWVACRLCHNAQFPDHEIDRHAIKDMRCDSCQTVQPCAQTCAQCHASMGEYFCKVCNLFDNDGATKQVFHCDGCGICRVGGRENYFHCATCCGCYPHSLQDKHKCLEGSMHRECAICLEVTFASLESVHVLPCGHVLHGGCWEDYIRHGHYRCPSCRTRMFWSENDPSDEHTNGNDDEEEDDDNDDDDGEEDEEGGDETVEDNSDGSGSGESSSDHEGARNRDINTVLGESLAATAANASSTSPPPAPTALSTESGVAHRLVNAIFSALANGGGMDRERERDHAARGPVHTPQ